MIGAARWRRISVDSRRRLKARSLPPSWAKMSSPSVAALNQLLKRLPCSQVSRDGAARLAWATPMRCW